MASTPYTRFVQRRYPCAVSRCNRVADPHHLRTVGSSGQVDEGNVSPLCRWHHTEIHQCGKRTFARRYGLCLPGLALIILADWQEHDGERELDF